MRPLEILLIAVGLSMDAFAVSLAAGCSGVLSGVRAELRLALHFGFFQFFMPVLGWYMGTRVASAMQTFDHWVAFGLLAFVGGRMIRSGFDPHREEVCQDPSRGWTLVSLSVATSIDALAVGLSLALIHVDIWYPSLIIGGVTATLSFGGVRLGNRLGIAFGKKMEITGGVILLLIGLRIVLGHLWG